MPIYEYECECGKRFDRFQVPNTPSAERECECGKKAKLVQPRPGWVKVGTGFDTWQDQYMPDGA